MAVLIVLGPPEAGTKFLVAAHGNTVIGRDAQCDVTLNRKSISRFHAQLISNKGTVYLEDSGSTNGTYLNGKKLTKRAQVRDGDRIELHDVPMVFYSSNNATTEESRTERFDPQSKTVAETEIVTVDPGASELRAKLETFLEIAKGLGSSFDCGVIFPQILDLLFQMYPQAVVGEIHLETVDGRVLPVAMKHGRDSDSTDLTSPSTNDDLLKEVMKNGVGLIRSEANGPVDSALSELRSTICMPILSHTNIALGCILLMTDDASHPFDEEDRNIISAVSVLTGQAIGYSRAHDIVVQHAKIERQLETAREIQLSILPHSRPEIANYAFADYYSAAERVGGDYYFYETLPDGRILLGIADASGKGLPAAMNIVSFAGEIRYRVATSKSFKKAMESINHFVCQGELCSFITCCICLLNPKTNQIVCMNAGHMPPLMKRGNGMVKEFVTPGSGLPFGVSPTEEYHANTYQLEPGDQVLLYTDGVSEAMNPQRKLYGTDPVRTVMQKNRKGVESLVEDLVADVVNFRKGTPASDDTTIVAFEFMKPK